MSIDILSLRTQLSSLSLKWSNLPEITKFDQYPITIPKVDTTDDDTTTPNENTNNENTNTGIITDTNTDFIDSEIDDTEITINVEKCRVVGYRTPTNPKYQVFNQDIMEMSLFVVSDLCNYICVSVGYSHPDWWYIIPIIDKHIDIPKIEYLLEQYDRSDIETYSYCDYAILGNSKKMNITMEAVEHHIMTSKLVEVFTWGSKYSGYPYNKDEVDRSIGKTKIEFITNARKQSSLLYTMSFTTLYSQSIIKVIQHRKFIVYQIQYNPISYQHPIINILNDDYDKTYPEDFPVDVIIAILQFPYLSFREIVEEYSDSVEEMIPFLKVMIPLVDQPKFYQQCYDFYPAEIVNQIRQYF